MKSTSTRVRSRIEAIRNWSPTARQYAIRVDYEGLRAIAQLSVREIRASSKPDLWHCFGGIDERIAQSAVTGIIAMDFAPLLAHGESRDRDRRFENLERLRPHELGRHFMAHA